MAPLAEVSEWPEYSRMATPANAATLLAASSAAIRNYCGWNISRESVIDEPIDSRGSGLLSLPTLLLISIEELSIDGTVLVYGTDYNFSKKGLVRRLPRGSIWPRGFQAVTASFTHGYADVPEDIKALTVGLAMDIADPPPSGVSQKVVGAISITYASRSSSVALDAGSMAILDAYALGA